MADWRVASETGRLTDVLLCRPEHYRWLPLNAIARESLAEGQADQQQVQREYREFEDALRHAGVRCHFLPPEPHLPYQCYTRDSSQTTPWGVLLTQMFKPERRGEYAAIMRFHDRFWRLANHGTIEGGDIAIIRPGLAAIGHTGSRTDLAGAAQLAGWLRDAGWEVRLVPLAEHFLHLDVVFCMAADGLAVAFPEALEPGFLDWLRAHHIRLVEARYAEVMALSCNLLSLGGGRVISARHSTRLNAALRAEGLAVLDPELRVICQGGGGPHCLSMPLWRDPGL